EAQELIADAREAREETRIRRCDGEAREEPVAARLTRAPHDPRRPPGSRETPFAAPERGPRDEERLDAAHVPAADVVELVRRRLGRGRERGLDVRAEAGAGESAERRHARETDPRGARAPAHREERRLAATRRGVTQVRPVALRRRIERRLVGHALARGL